LSIIRSPQRKTRVGTARPTQAASAGNNAAASPTARISTVTAPAGNSDRNVGEIRASLRVNCEEFGTIIGFRWA